MATTIAMISINRIHSVNTYSWPFFAEKVVVKRVKCAPCAQWALQWNEAETGRDIYTADRQTDKQTDRQTDSQTDRQTERQKDRRKDRQTDIQRQRQCVWRWVSDPGGK